jgi:hypothetical protein
MEAIPRLTAITANGSEAETDEELAERAAGNREAQTALYLRHRDAVFRYLRGRCRDEDTALDRRPSRSRRR